MELSQFTDYSLRTLMYLAVREDDSLSSIDEISTSYGISRNHLVKVVHNLAKLGYLTTFRGKGGGITLAKAAEEINIGEVVRQTEKMALVECFDGRSGTCCLDGACHLKHLLHRATLAFVAELDRATLADITTPSKEIQRRLKIK